MIILIFRMKCIFSMRNLVTHRWHTQSQFYLETWDFFTFSSLTKWFLLSVKLLFVFVLASYKIKQNAFLFKQKYM